MANHVRARARPVRSRASALLGLSALVLLEAAALLLLVHLGRRAPFDLPLDPPAWTHADPADALAAVVRWLALGATAWLLLVTVASVVLATADGRNGRARRRSGSQWRAAALVPRALRLLARQALVGGVAIGVAAAPAAAQAGRNFDPPVVTVVRDGRGGDLASLPGTAARGSAEPVASLPAAAPLTDGRVVVVGPGEHLWELAAREVARAQGVPREAVADRTVTPYWQMVCDANRARLASGDVNLVYVGETVVLPPLG